MKFRFRNGGQLVAKGLENVFVGVMGCLGAVRSRVMISGVQVTCVGIRKVWTNVCFVSDSVIVICLCLRAIKGERRIIVIATQSTLHGMVSPFVLLILMGNGKSYEFAIQLSSEMSVVPELG